MEDRNENDYMIEENNTGSVNNSSSDSCSDITGTITLNLRDSYESEEHVNSTMNTGSITANLQEESSDTCIESVENNPTINNDVIGVNVEDNFHEQSRQDDIGEIISCSNSNATCNDHSPERVQSSDDDGRDEATILYYNDTNCSEVAPNNNPFYISNDEMANDTTDEDTDNEEVIINENDFQIPYSKLFDLLEKDESNETITVNFVVNIIQVQTAILKFANLYSLPNSGIADLCKMFNCFFDKPLIPDSRYLVDKLFYPREGIKYHAVCPICKNYVKEFNENDRYVFCNICEAHVNVKNPTYNDFFVTLDIKTELKSLFENNADYYLKIINNIEQASQNITDIHDGRRYKNFVASLVEASRKSYATLTYNTDGSPVFRSSRFSVWPIQVYTNEIPPSIRNKQPICYALWFGHNKPNMNIFMAPFVEDINKLSEEGIPCTINNEVKHIKIFAICCCVDSVARSSVQGFVQYNGYYGCSWCLHSGQLISHNTGAAVKYPLTNEIPQKRSTEATLRHIGEAINSGASVYGVKKATPILNLRGFSIIGGFVPDAMHCIALGVAKQFANYWFDPSNHSYRVSNFSTNQINSILQTFKVPTQVARLSRSLKDRKFWKAREYENWVLYYSLPVLADIPNFQIYFRHWAHLVESFHLLMKDSINLEELKRADVLLKQFVAETQYYYSKDAMTYNVHQLTHIAQSVADWGPLWAHSCYTFESGNGEIVKTVHAAKGVISQICRNLRMKESIRIMEKKIADKEDCPIKNYCFYLENRYTQKTLKIGNNRYFQKCIVDEEHAHNLDLSTEDIKAYKKMIKDTCVYKSNKKVLLRSDNSFAITINKEYIQIVQFIVDNINGTELTLCKGIEVENMLTDLCTSIKKVIRIDDNVKLIQTSEIEKPCVFMTVGFKKYISAVPNIHNYS